MSEFSQIPPSPVWLRPKLQNYPPPIPDVLKVDGPLVSVWIRKLALSTPVPGMVRETPTVRVYVVRQTLCTVHRFWVGRDCRAYAAPTNRY